MVVDHLDNIFFVKTTKTYMEKKNQKNSLAQIDITWSKHFLPSAEGPGFFLHQLISIYLFFYNLQVSLFVDWTWHFQRMPGSSSTSSGFVTTFLTW